MHEYIFWDANVIENNYFLWILIFYIQHFVPFREDNCIAANLLCFIQGKKSINRWIFFSVMEILNMLYSTYIYICYIYAINYLELKTSISRSTKFAVVFLNYNKPKLKQHLVVQYYWLIMLWNLMFCIVLFSRKDWSEKRLGERRGI